MADNNSAHHAVERFEKIWIMLSLVLLVIFVSLVFYAVSIHGAHIGHAEPRQDPQKILAMPEFADPGVVQTGPNSYQVNMVAQAFSFIPGDIEVPEGAEVTFRMTSRDVIHGFQVRGTNINVELIPGDIASLTYTFDRPGEYLIICNQYCGVAHQNMLGKIHVGETDAEQVAGTDDEPAEAPAADAWMADAERAWNSQCAACHGRDGSGARGAFPPLADGHAPALVAGDGGREYLINVVLYGLAGAIEVDGVSYRGMMPGMARLSDEDIAAALNHSLHAWGNADELPDAFARVTSDEVAQQRDRGLSTGDVLEQRKALGLD